MNDKNIENSLVRYLNASAGKDDLDVLNEWIKNPSNKAAFKTYLKTHFIINSSMNTPDANKIKERLLHEIRSEKRRLKKQQVNTFIKYAAIFVGIVISGYLIHNKILNDKVTPVLVVGEDAIVLEHENGSIEILNKYSNTIITDQKGNVIGKQKGEDFVYTKAKTAQKLVYNTLKIPYGKQLRVVLSDGTKVMLNAGSEFKYPVNFIEGRKRKVFLQGEAYFDVAHDSLHPFIVEANALDIQVLGTKFNLANYREDVSTEVVLVDGSVMLKSNAQMKNKAPIILSPGYKGVFKKTDETISAKEVNTSIYTAWTNGFMVFRKVRFQNILKKLERHYNVKIKNTNTPLASERFNATIDVENDDIDQVLEYFNKIYGIDYRIINNEVIIN